MRMICPIHGEFYQTPHSHISSSTGCRKCGYIRGSNKKRLTTREFIDRSNDIHGNKYDYSLSKYINSETTVSIICMKHGVFKQTPLGHMMSGSGCRKCGYETSSNKRKHTNEEFILESIKIHGNIYDYSMVNYINSFTDVKIVCPSHGIFKQNPHDHRRGIGCSKCNSSHGERLIRNILTERKIEFEEQKTFEWLRDKSKLRCDFYLPKYNTVIEYNGRQHYEVIEHFGGKSNFERGKKRDELKRQLLIENNVKLIEVRYDERDVEKFILNFL